METKSTSKFSVGFTVKLVTGISFFGIADTQMMGEVKTMWNWATSEAVSDTLSFTATPGGQVPIRPTADGKPGNCSIIELWTEKILATGTLGVAAIIPGNAQIMLKLQTGTK